MKSEIREKIDSLVIEILEKYWNAFQKRKLTLLRKSSEQEVDKLRIKKAVQSCERRIVRHTFLYFFYMKKKIKILLIYLYSLIFSS
jgi:hypothetical protein